jgi:hypothetical protein
LTIKVVHVGTLPEEKNAQHEQQGSHKWCEHNDQNNQRRLLAHVFLVPDTLHGISGL